MLNHTTVQGRLVADPEMRNTQAGVSVCSFRVAWSEKYKETETKLFLSCTAWRTTADLICKHFHKGKEIIVEGKLSTREWEDKEGRRCSSVEMTVDKVHFCGSKSEGETAGAASAPTYSTGYGGGVDVPGPDDVSDDGELPF